MYEEGRRSYMEDDGRNSLNKRREVDNKLEKK